MDNSTTPTSEITRAVTGCDDEFFSTERALETDVAYVATVDDVRATVRPWSERPPAPIPGTVCAALVCHRTKGASLYVNDSTNCDHAHLAKDANALIDAFDRDELDPGWGDLGNGYFGTFITTREAAAAAGVQGWSSPAPSSTTPG